MRIILDIETTLAHDRIWLAVTKDIDTGEVKCHTESSSLKPMIEAADLIIGHNVISFDLYLLQKLWKIPSTLKNCFDTLIASRLAKPDRSGGHSLENWGKILNTPKGDFTDFDAGLSKEMIKYCKQDVELTELVYDAVLKELFDVYTPFSEQSIELEHSVQRIIAEQERYGFLLDMPYTVDLLARVRGRMAQLEADFAEKVPPQIIQMKTKVKLKPFNPNSRQQIGEYLIKQGWKPSKFTETGKPMVDESTLASFDHPVARQLEEYLMLQKRSAQIDSWLEAADNDGVVRGRVITNGAITGRMTHHSPNMAQIPAVSSPYGRECRSCWIPRPGRVLVGIDASGLELRMLAHYMKDEAYVKTVCEGKQEDGTDIHSVNQKAAGLQTRAQAKTFIYAFLYGAGPAKIGAIVGGDANDGQELIARFLAQTPSLQRLRQRVANYAKKGWLPGIDGRVLWVRSEHAALNTLLQGAGAIVMKQALLLFNDYLKKENVDFNYCVNVHDEWQIECSEEDSDFVGNVGVQMIHSAGLELALRCPLTGEYRVGRNWAETH